MDNMLQKHRSVGVIPPYVLSQRRKNMFDKTICVVAGDRGGLNALLPVLSIALENGCNVHAFLAATCKTQYEASHLKLDSRIQVVTGDATMHDVGDFFSTRECDLLLIGASQSQEGAQAAIHAMSHKGLTTHIISVEDMYGSIGPIIDSAGEYFSTLCVIDQFAQEIAVERDITLTDRIAITGGPQFDKAVEVKQNWAERRACIRNALRAKDDTLVFLLAGGVNGSAELLEIVDKGIEIAGVEDMAQGLLRMHPRSTSEDQQVLGKYYADRLGILHEGDGKQAAANIDDLLPGVDFVLSGFSTVNHLGILYEMPGVVYVGTPAFRQDLMAEKNLERPPEVEAGAAWYVQTPEDMARVIRALTLSDVVKSRDVRFIRDEQHRIASYNDGHAAERVWQEMCKLMSK